MTRHSPRARPTRRRLVLPALLLVVAVVAAACVRVTPTSPLARSPYLTAVFADRASVNWATDQSDDVGTLQWGPAPACRAYTARATRSAITVREQEEWQWRVDLSQLTPGRTYCYRPLLGDTDLLAHDEARRFSAAPPPGDPSPYSFAVIGDWGQDNSEEASVLRQIGESAASFVVTVGDNAYPSGDQDSYGDLSGGAVFGSDQLPSIGQRPIFAAQGNHGFLLNRPYLQNFPSDTVARASGGRYRVDRYCCTSVMESSREDYASAWYAFDWGNARFYVLESAWSDGARAYEGDFEAHWSGAVPGCTACGKQLEWLRKDLAAHASTPTKLAFLHYPFHADSSAERGNPFISGPNALEGLLAGAGVDVAFSGHSHVYERNHPQVGDLVTYVTGGGGGALAAINSCSAFDAYAIGSESACRAPLPDAPPDVFHYLLVTVNGDSITVAPTDSKGKTFDVQTFSTGT